MTQYNVIYKDKSTELIEAYDHWKADGVDCFDKGGGEIWRRKNVLIVEVLP